MLLALLDLCLPFSTICFSSSSTDVPQVQPDTLRKWPFRRHAAGGEPYVTPCEGPSWGNVAGLSLPLPLGEGTCLLGRNAPGLWPSGSLKTIHAK